MNNADKTWLINKLRSCALLGSTARRNKMRDADIWWARHDAYANVFKRVFGEAEYDLIPNVEKDSKKEKKK